jgi:DNA polymerase
MTMRSETPLFLDLETYSTVPIKHGTYAYAEGAKVLLIAFALGDAAPQVIDLTKSKIGLRGELLRLAALSKTWVIHNSQFDVAVIGKDMPEGVTVIDTMIQAFSHALPGALAKLGEVLKLPQELKKGRAGKELIKRFCMGDNPGTHATHPEEWAAFVEYAKQDIVVMRAAHAKMPRGNYPNNAFERELFNLDQRINQRGVPIDMEFVRAAVETLQAATKDTATAASEATGGAVESATQRDALLKFINETFDMNLSDLKRATVDKLMDDDTLPDALRDLLRIRQLATRTSTAKYQALLNSVNSDGRLRGTLQFCGASRTGRWAGRLFQPQNLPRPKRKALEIEADIEIIKDGNSWLIGDVQDACSDALRGVINASPGHCLAVADLSNIEGRVQAWLAGEHWKLEAFREFDAGRGADLYNVAYARAFNVDVTTVTPAQRQIGKVMELALGYGGGVGAFVTFASAYKIDLDALATTLRGKLPRADVDAASAWLASSKSQTHGLKPDTFVTCDVLKRLWRKAHPQITALWYSLEDDLRNCASGSDMGSWNRRGNWARYRLPSGRYLCYPGFAVTDDGVIQYSGFDRMSYSWARVTTYGGKLFENICQAVARDVLAHGMLNAEGNGLPVVLTVHDEILAEAPLPMNGQGDKLAALMATVPVWAQGLPLAAKGFTTLRYRKE